MPIKGGSKLASTGFPATLRRDSPTNLKRSTRGKVIQNQKEKHRKQVAANIPSKHILVATFAIFIMCIIIYVLNHYNKKNQLIAAEIAQQESRNRLEQKPNLWKELLYRIPILTFERAIAALLMLTFIYWIKRKIDNDEKMEIIRLEYDFNERKYDVDKNFEIENRRTDTELEKIKSEQQLKIYEIDKANDIKIPSYEPSKSILKKISEKFV